MTNATIHTNETERTTVAFQSPAGRDVTIAECRAWFEIVQNAKGWKGAVDAEVKGSVETIGIITKAVTFYHGGNACRVQVLETLPGDIRRVRITNRGYAC